MSPRLVPAGADPVRRTQRPVTVTVDGESVSGAAGQTVAGVLLASGRRSWRAGPSGAQRGVFCGIGVCFDCLVTVNGERDVRACRRRVADGDEVSTQSRETPSLETPEASDADAAPEPNQEREAPETPEDRS